MSLNEYKMQDVEFVGDEWELICSSVFLKYSKKVNILELGYGNYSLLYAVCSIFCDNINMILSVDAKNKFDKNNKEFYEKKKIFHSLANRKFKFVEHFQGDFFDGEILKLYIKLFSDNRVNLFITEYMNSDEYMNEIFNSYSFYFADNVDIYYHNLNKNENSRKYFEKISSGKKSIMLNNTLGTGIIKI